jgi:ectoine hydroxylase-related dioxygenase (phytanoyl-CoA dioxygenase family)
MWIPLQPVPPASGSLRFARGSHRDFPLYRPTLFVTDESLPSTDGEEIADLDLRQCTIDEPTYELGDISVHHGQTLHSAGPNLGVSSRGAYSIRYFGPRARFRRKPGLIAKDWQSELVDGDELPAKLWGQAHRC